MRRRWRDAIVAIVEARNVCLGLWDWAVAGMEWLRQSCMPMARMALLDRRLLARRARGGVI